MRDDFFTDWWVVLELRNGETCEGWGVGSEDDEVILRTEPSQIEIAIKHSAIQKIHADKSRPTT